MTQALFSFGKYAVYIWPALGISLAIFVGMIVDTMSSAYRWRRKVRELERPPEP